MKVFRIANASTIEEHSDLLDIFINCFFDILKSQIKANNHIEDDARIIFQMVVSKFLHIKKTLEGASYTDKDGIKLLNSLVDPTVIAVLMRNLFETICMFHLIYVKTNTEEEKKIVHNLWQIAGLNFRQRFKDVAFTDESKDKAEAEENIIKKLTKEIESSALFIQLNEKNKNKILNSIKNKDYKISFSALEVNLLSWADISRLLLREDKTFKDLYTLFSLYAHPSHVSVFQYRKMFTGEKPNESLASSLLKFCLTFCSIFLADFIKVFPSALEVFEKQSTIDQISMNLYNLALRGKDFSINDASKNL